MDVDGVIGSGCMLYGLRDGREGEEGLGRASANWIDSTVRVLGVESASRDMYVQVNVRCHVFDRVLVLY